MSLKIKNSFLGKVSAIFLIAAFSFYNCDISSAVTQAEIKSPGSASDNSVLSVEDIGIAIDAGTIRSKFAGQTGKTIVHIQDAHCNFEAQSNISRILEQLSRDSGIAMISVEGAEGTVDTAWFRAFPDAEIRREVATYFMKKGEITGAEFFSINSDYNGTIFGAETRDYYVQNLRAFLDMYPYKEAILSYFNDLKSAGEKLKSIIYPPKLRELDRNAHNFESKEMDLSKYAEYLVKASAENGVDTAGYANFTKLTDTLEYEKKIDFDVVDGERARYIDALSKMLSKEEMADLVAESIKFKKGYIKAVDFYSHLRDLAKAHDIPMMQEYPNLFYYYIYSKIYDGIDIEGLFREIDLVERAVKKKLIKDETQDKLDKLSEKVEKLIGLVNIELTNDDYDRFRKIADAFTLDDVVSFYDGMAGRYNLDFSLGEVPSVVRENMPKMVDFYEIAIKRDMALVENTLAQMEREGKDRSVLIAGGFHTRGMADILEKKGVSYVVVTPKITKDVESPYIQVLTNQRTSIEDIITESAMPGTKNENVSAGENAGGLLSPLLRFGWGITMLLDDNQKALLQSVSDELGKVDGGAKFEDAVKESFRTTVRMMADRWLSTVKSNMVERLGMDEDKAEEEFLKFANDDSLWAMLQSVYVGKYDDYFRSVNRVASPAVKAQIVLAFSEYRNGYLARGEIGEGDGAATQSPGRQKAGDRVLKDNDEIKNFDQIIRFSFDSGKANEEAFRVSGVFGPEIDGKFRFFAHEGLNSSLETAGLPANVHPGRGGEAKMHQAYQAHMDKYVFDNLTDAQRTTLARHELAHLVIANAEDIAYNERKDYKTRGEVELTIEGRLGRQAFNTWKMWEKFVEREFSGNFQRYKDRALSEQEMETLAELQERFVNSLPNSDVTGVVARMNAISEAKKASDQKALRETLRKHAKEMSTSVADEKGPDVVIVVSSTDDLADFWQKRLTWDGLHGSGAVVKKSSVVLSVSETNWTKGAGNGLGTLNGFIRAARKAQDLNIIETDVPSGKVNLTQDDINKLADAFSAYLKRGNKSAFMFHTAGKGTRTAPLPGVEGNSKPNIKLPEMVDVGGVMQPMTILEGVMKAISRYADTRKGRLGVFWGDQVIINQNPVGDEAPKHHVEIFGQNVPLDESIQSYGVLIAGDQPGDAMQREKLPMKEVEDLLKASNKGPDEVYKSIGSFTISNDFLMALLKDNVAGSEKSLESTKGSLDTDPDWWQPLTSSLDEYKAMMAKKKKSPAVAEAQWNKMNALWNNFNSQGKGKIGVTDVGKDSLWWDYGQNKYYLRNMQILTEKDTVDGVSSREFFGIDSWIKGSTLGDANDVSDTEKRFTSQALAEGRAVGAKDGKKYLDIQSSVVQNSTIKSGRLKNCVVIDSYLENVDAENAVIIGSTVFKLNAKGALVYNVVNDEVPALTEGQILTNVFHPTVGRIQMQMRTDVSRDGSVDWEQEVFVYDNLYTYADVAKLMAESGITMDVIKILRDNAARALIESREASNTRSANELKNDLLTSRNKKAGTLKTKALELKSKAEGVLREDPKGNVRSILREAGLNELWAARAELDEPEARKIVAYSIMVTEGRTSMDVAEYMEMFAMVPNPANIRAAEEELVAVRKLVELSKVDRRKYYAQQEPLAFGTSGLRDTVERLTDMEVYINARGFIRYLIEQGEIVDGDSVAIAGDLRPSTPRLMTAVARAIEDEGLANGYSLGVDLRGFLPSPSVALDGFIGKKPSVMVTGSHIPADRNGIKFNKKSGEVLKQDEKGILSKVKEARAEETALDWQVTLFDQAGKFKDAPVYALQSGQDESIEVFVNRYTSVFGTEALKDKKVFIYQHSAVGRDIISDIYRKLGATVITPGVDEFGGYIEGKEEDNIIRVTYTDEKTGKEVTENVNLRSEEFVPVDTEKVSNKTKAILKAVAAKYAPDVIISTDGDSDRPLFVDEEGNFLVGDKLGLLAVKFMVENDQKPAMVALPESTNEGVVAELESMGIKVIKTKIGSPHVIKAMNDWTRPGRGHENDIVCGWEANGGFLLGSDIKLFDKDLRSLPTRDAVFPTLSGILLSGIKRVSVKELIEKETPAVYNGAGVFDDFRDKDGKKLTGNDGMPLMKATLAKFSPNLADKTVIRVNFDAGTVLRRARDEEAGEGIEDKYFFETVEENIDTLSPADLAEITRVKDLFGNNILTKDRGFGQISSISVLDGIKIFFSNGEISHFRPSGNAPEFRNYTTASTQERAEEMLAVGLKELVPSMVTETLNSPSGSTELPIWSPGRQAATVTPASPEVQEVADLLRQGYPAMIKPHKEAKVWGVNGIGEYWYGAEAGDKTSVVSVRDANGKTVEAPLNEVLSYAPDVLGKDALDNFGQMLPLVKILTPQGRLSAQFHDAKNELWIVTGIDPKVQNPSIILGFSKASVDRFGSAVNAEYKKALENYGEKLNALIDAAEDIGITQAFQGDILEKAKDYPAMGSYVAELESAKGELEWFYNYRPVKVGEVIPVPAGTLHALGTGVEVVEPQIAGLTQSLEDGATYPVRYYFPGHERPGAQKQLDIDRVGEMIPAIAVETSPEIISEQPNGEKVERLPGNFESKGLEVNRITVRKDAASTGTFRIGSMESIHNLVVVKGEASVLVAGQRIKIPAARAGEPMMMIPPTAGQYTIVADADGDSEIILTLTPKAEKWNLETPVEKGSGVSINGEMEYGYEVTPRFLEFETMVDVRDEVNIHAGQKAESSPIIAGRAHKIKVLDGTVVVTRSTGEEVVVAAGEEFLVDENYSNVSLLDPGRYEIVNRADLPAKVEVSYSLTQEEKVAYETISTLKKHIPVIKGKKIRAHVPNEIFPSGGKTVVGSRLWTQEIMQNLLGPDIILAGYDSALGFSRLKTSSEDDVVEILIADNKKLEAEKEVKGSEEFLKSVRVLPIPENALSQKGGWDFCLEVVGWSMILGAVGPEQIRDKADLTSPAADMHKFLTKVLKRQVEREHLFLMLSFNEANTYLSGLSEDERTAIQEKIGDVSDVVTWMKNLVKNILFQMPIRPFDPADTLRQRLKVMWSA